MKIRDFHENHQKVDFHVFCHFLPIQESPPMIDFMIKKTLKIPLLTRQYRVFTLLGGVFLAYIRAFVWEYP